jgi:CubicO group peptidase (beta-lactamase class C family)
MVLSASEAVLRSRFEDLLATYIDRGVIPGGVIALRRPGSELAIVASGTTAPEGPAFAPDAVFRIQSMTKAVTSVAALRLVEQGAIGLDDGIDAWMPELADRRVLASPSAELHDTVAAERSITLRDLLTNTSGYGSILTPSPLQRAMEDNGTAGGPEPPALDAEEWLRRLASLPLAFQPGRGWRYHHSFSILGILLARVGGTDLGTHLRTELFDPLDMPDTGLTVPEQQAARLPAAFRHVDGALIETEPAAVGFYVGDPPFDVSHGELVATARDYSRFLAMLANGGTLDGVEIVSAESIRMMTSDQVAPAVKTDDSFFPGFWTGVGWGFGVSVETSGGRAGRYGWAGGQGTDFFVDPDGTAALLLTQVELGEAMAPLLEDFQAVSPLGR